ncbi:hypothetical protein [Serratia microhaemolytica]|uniref:hypothetical protein n=1 Tax=Serratia microhaemolytica TaxID=2675110 RepID=UPI000FDDA224|nr:hypothetical protein [Serratia microhaemolytica]
MGISSLRKKLHWSLSVILTLCCIPQDVTAAAGPSGTYSPGSGFVWSTRISSSWTARGSPAFPIPLAHWGVGGMLTDAFTTTQTCINPSRYGTSSDGMLTGLQLAPDVILGMTSGTMRGDYYERDVDGTELRLRTVSGSWLNNGQLSTTAVSNGVWCIGTLDAPPGLFAFVRLSDNRGTMAGIIELYIGPNAPIGTVNSPRIGLGAAYISTATGVREVLTASQFTITPPTDCTIGVLDNNVAFGVVTNPLADQQVLATYPSQLTIQCSSINDNQTGSGQATLQLSFNGLLGRSADTLSLHNTSQETLAEIRGIRASGSGDCTNTHPEQILFNNQPVSIANVGVGLTEIPLTWTLCSSASRKYGSGTAQAIVTISWP